MRSRGSVKNATSGPTGAVGAPADSQAARFLLRIVDAGMAAAIFVVPMIMGGRQAPGRLALTSIAVIIALAWLARQCFLARGIWRRTATGAFQL